MTRAQLERRAFRLECERDLRIRSIRYVLLSGIQAGDDLMAYWQFPSPELVAYIKGIGEAYR